MSCQREWSAPTCDGGASADAAALDAAPGADRGRGGARIEDDRSLTIDDRHAQLDARLLDAVDVGAEAARVERAKDRLEAVDLEDAARRCVLDHRRHQLGGVDERVLGRFAVARVDVAELAIHQEADAERVGDEDADEDAGALGHAAACLTRRSSRPCRRRWRGG